MSDCVCKLENDGKSVVRLYDGEGEHCLSLLPCGADENGKTSCVDLALPSGKVLYCGVPLGLVDVLVEHVGLEEI